MNIKEILSVYDKMFGKNSLEEIDSFLETAVVQAVNERDIPSLITLLNERIGFCRDTDQREKALESCDDVLRIMGNYHFTERLEYATTLINVANAYRAFGLLQKSLGYYKEAEKRYLKELSPEDFRFAELYNNWSLLYQELEDFESAAVLLQKALAVVLLYPDAEIEQATTRTNLAITLLKLHRYENAQTQLKKAISLFQKHGGQDYHYSGALAAMGDAALFMEDYENAVHFYQEALNQIEIHTGKTGNYRRIQEKLYLAQEKLLEKRRYHFGNEPAFRSKGMLEKRFSNHLEASRYFYQKYFSKVIQSEFAEWEDKIAVGFSGEGSDCLGYEDEISKDHDCEIRLVLWVTKETKEEIGEDLQEAYEKCLQEYIPVTRKKANKNRHLEKRSGVVEIEEFYYQILGVSKFPETEREWYFIKDEQLCTATNGEVFFDKQGIVTRIRKVLSYYPEKVRLWKLAERVHEFSQCGQYNYARMMARGDYMTAKLCQYKAMEAAMSIVYLLNKTYAPYYKWMRRGLQDLKKLPEIGDILDAMADMEDQRAAWKGVEYSSEGVNGADQIALTFEMIAKLLLHEMVSQETVRGEQTYLDVYTPEIFRLADRIPFVRISVKKEELLEDKKAMYEKENSVQDREAEPSKEKLIEAIVKLEWKQFDGVINEGGRAACQDDWETFQIMRRSQYLTWNEELLASYYQDLVHGENEGWNLIMEKYARMMESTAPKEYEFLKHRIPQREEERLAIQEEIIRIQVNWMEQFAEQYPHMAYHARNIHTSEDTPYETSYETYLRGELGTYSDRTLILYGRFIADLQKEDKNLAYLTMKNTALLYGYSSLEEAEKKVNS